jgi:hypothetical protein
MSPVRQRHELADVGQQLVGRTHQLREAHGLLQLAVDAHFQLEDRRVAGLVARADPIADAEEAVEALELHRRPEEALVRHRQVVHQHVAADLVGRS